MNISKYFKVPLSLYGEVSWIYRICDIYFLVDIYKIKQGFFSGDQINMFIKYRTKTQNKTEKTNN